MRTSEIWDEGGFNILTAELGTSEGTIGEYILNNRDAFVFAINLYYDFEALDKINPTNIRTFIKTVAMMYGDEWQKLYNMYNKDYDPLANKDLIEIEQLSGTDTMKRDDISDGSGDSDFNRNDETSSTSSTTYDRTDYVPTTKVVNTGGSHTHASVNSSLDRTDKTDYGKKTTFTSKGNIGVMPTQDLFDREVNLRLSKHLEDIIIACIVEATISGVCTDVT